MAFVRHRRQKKKQLPSSYIKNLGKSPHLHSNDVKKNTDDKNTTLVLFFLFEKKKEQKNI